MSCLRKFFQWIFIVGFIGFSTPSFSRIGSLLSLDNSLVFGCLRAFSKKHQREKQLLEWGEAQLGRPFTDEEANAFKWTQSALAFLNPLARYKVLSDAGFSPSERKKLIKAIPLMEPDEEVRVRVPEKTNEEQRLKAQDFNSAYTRGIDEANEWIVVAEQLREGTVDPFTTYVDYFPKKTLEHIQDLEKQVENPQQKRNLLRWKRYVEKKQQNKSFTYEDWLKVNWNLSKTLDDGRDWRLENLRHIEILIHAFPYIIAMPTTTGAVGIMTLNRAGTHGIHALGLNDSYYFEHDLGHAVSTTKYPPIWFYENMNRLSKGLPIQKRKNIHLSYWFITHENSYGENWFLSRKTMKTVLGACAFNTVHDELKGLIDTSSKEKVRQRLEEAIQNFTDIFVLAKRRALWL